MWFEKIDARQFAALRIVFGALALATVVGLWPNAQYYYSNGGWFPLGKALEVTADREWSVLHMITSSAGVNAYFAILASACLGLMLGFRTRLCAIACFIGIVSLHS